MATHSPPKGALLLIANDLKVGKVRFQDMGMVVLENEPVVFVLEDGYERFIRLKSSRVIIFPGGGVCRLPLRFPTDFDIRGEFVRDELGLFRFEVSPFTLLRADPTLGGGVPRGDPEAAVFRPLVTVRVVGMGLGRVPLVLIVLTGVKLGGFRFGYDDILGGCLSVEALCSCRRRVSGVEDPEPDDGIDGRLDSRR